MLGTSLSCSLALSMAACHRAHPLPAAEPHIEVVRPDSVVVPRGAVVEVIIVGRGFAPGRPGLNAIDFSGMTVANVPANAEGTEMRFVIPEALPSGGEAPPMPLLAGPYTVRVTTAAGTSNTVTIRVYR